MKSLVSDTTLEKIRLYYLSDENKLSEHDELGITGSVAGMLGAFPASEYRGFFTKRKTKNSDHNTDQTGNLQWEYAESGHHIKCMSDQRPKSII